MRESWVQLLIGLAAICLAGVLALFIAGADSAFATRLLAWFYIVGLALSATTVVGTWPPKSKRPWRVASWSLLICYIVILVVPAALIVLTGPPPQD